MSKPKLFLLSAGFAFIVSASLGAMDWPSPGGLVTANFGLNERGRPCLGTVFRSEGPIAAAGRGELVFYRGQEDGASRLPSPLGSWAAYDHGDGILGIYGRFAGEESAVPEEILPPENPGFANAAGNNAGRNAALNAPAANSAGNAASDIAAALGGDGGAAIPRPWEPPVQPRQGERIAVSGISGWSVQNGFYFALYDRRERRWANPSLIIVPLPDDRPPEILSVQLQDSAGRLIPPAQVRIGQGRYSIIVNVTDTLSRSSPLPLAPYRLGVFLNGAEAGILSFETFSARDGILSVRRNGLVPVSEVYAPYPALKAGEAWFTRGQTSLELIARDVIGNEASLIRRLEVE
jgi:hypothetical protein